MAPPKPPTSLVEFCRRFPSAEECADYLFQVRWPEGFVCPRCNELGGYLIAARKSVECSNPACRCQTSITAGTVLHRTKQSLHTWFWAAYLVTNLTPSISAKQFQEQLGIKRYETAFMLLHKLRAALVAPGRDMLRGEVEVDETYIGGPEEGTAGRGVTKKKLVVAAVELLRWVDDKTRRERVRCGRVRMQIIPNASGSSLKKFLINNVTRGACVWTDGWRGYSFLEAAGYHQKVRTKDEEEDHLPYFHRVVSNLKTWLLGTYHGGVQGKHLPAYLNEFVFRFNRRYLEGKGFNRALGLAATQEGPTYEAFYNTGKRGGWRHKVGSKTNHHGSS